MKKAIIIDDNPEIGRMVSRMLETEGFASVVLTSGEDILDHLRAEALRQYLRLCRPFLVKGAVIDEAEHQLTAIGGQKLDLEQLVPEWFAVLQVVTQTRHQIADRLCRDRKILDQHHLLLIALTLEHRVVNAPVVMPDAKFHTHAVMQRRRTENLGLGQRKAGETLLKGGKFAGQLRFVLGGVDAIGGHGGACVIGAEQGRGV